MLAPMVWDGRRLGRGWASRRLEPGHVRVHGYDEVKWRTRQDLREGAGTAGPFVHNLVPVVRTQVAAVASRKQELVVWQGWPLPLSMARGGPRTASWVVAIVNLAADIAAAAVLAGTPAGNRVGSAP